MNEKDARAQWDSWTANQYFGDDQPLPDREMLEGLIDCDDRAEAGDLARFKLPGGLKIGEVAEELLKRFYP